MINLYYWPTPNARKVSILFEELKLKYNLIKVDINKGEQFFEKFLKISPNNKIPAIEFEENGKKITLFESGVILLFFAEKYNKFYSNDKLKRFEIIQWLTWQMAGFGPMLGQAHHFNFYAKEKINYAQERYSSEANRLYGVLDNKLKDQEWITGEYSIADIAVYPWTMTPDRQGVELSHFDNVIRWKEQMKKRSAVAKGMSVGQEMRKNNQVLTDDEYSNLFGKNQYKKR
ncbi:MAG: thiol:disulfide oxidoreductase [Alphaproteobacteria bacterium]|jgi:GST-like protein|nr:MAG: thiol:disulfide oxidoreductase [Alphaproteobacteria bacterium]|tara:strand:+ start:122 stop:811 length:690 start_codon:yes stop_codon:yes gene_type:complete